MPNFIPPLYAMIPLFLISLGPSTFPITGPLGIPPTSQPASTFECNPSYRQSSSEPISHPPKVPRFPGIRLTDKSQSVLSDYLRANIQELREEYRFHSIVSAAPPLKVKFDFLPPSLEDGFLERVFKDNVSLQRAYFDPIRLSIIGDTRVTNFFYEKKVSAVCTWNNWDKEFEVHAEFNGTHDATDIFTFELPICCSHNSTMQFAIRYITGGQVFWDNNQGKNYMVRINFPTFAASDTTIKEESGTPNGDKCT